MHRFLLDSWVRHNHHDEGRLREFLNYRGEALVVHHERLERIISLHAAQFELFDNIRDLLESV